MAYNQTKKTPDLGIGYKGTYTDKEGNEQGYIKLLIRAEQLAGVEADEKGMIKLTVFPSLSKKKETDPDLVVKPALSKGKSAPAAQTNNGVQNAKSKGSNFPF